MRHPNTEKVGAASDSTGVAVIVIALCLVAPLTASADGPATVEPGAVPVVAFVTGHGEPSIHGEFSAVADALGNDYSLREVDLAVGDSPLAGVAVAVVAGAPDIPDAELYELDQFLMQGGRVAFLLDAADIPPDGLQANVSEGNIFSFVEAYGVTVRADLVLDPVSARSARWSAAETTDPYPYWPRVEGTRLAHGHPAVGDVESVQFAWSSSIGLDMNMPGDASATVLARSSNESWTVMSFADLDPGLAFAPDGRHGLVERTAGGFPLAVVVTGTFDSAFRGQKLIVERGGRAEMTTPVGTIESSAPTRMAVVGGSRTFRNELVDQLPGSIAFVEGIVAWLAVGEAPLAGASDQSRDGGGRVRTGSYSAAGAIAVILIAIAARRRRATR